MNDWLNPRFVVAILVMALFTVAYLENVDNQTLIGALIGAFNLAIGYYLGSSNSANKASENTGKALDLAAASAPPPPPMPVTVTNTEAQAVPVEAKG